MTIRPNIPHQIFIGAMQGEPSCAEDNVAYEVWPKLMVMVLLNGAQHFEMDGMRFDIDAGHAEDARPTVFILNVADFCSLRFFNESTVPLHKVMISAPRPWIETVLQTNPADMPKLKRFLAGHLNSFQFTPAEKTVKAAEQILNPPPVIDKELLMLHRRMNGMDILYAAFSTLLGRVDAEDEDGKTGYQARMSRQRQAERIRDHVLENIGRDLSINSIAAAIGSNASTIQRCFKDHFGMTLFEFIRKERLERARITLETEGISVSQAAYMVGYDNPASFATAFRKVYGVAPRHKRS